MAFFTAVQNVRFWHKADIGGLGLLLCKLTPEPPISLDSGPDRLCDGRRSAERPACREP
jgi:hypothetical protein